MTLFFLSAHVLAEMNIWRLMLLILVPFNLWSILWLEFLFQHSILVKKTLWTLKAKYFCIEVVPKAAHSIYFCWWLKLGQKAGSFFWDNPESLPLFVCAGRGEENGDTDVWGVTGLDIIADEICIICFSENFGAIWSRTLISYTLKNFNSFQLLSQNRS